MTDDYVATNKAVWEAEADFWAGIGERLWKLDAPEWGNWGVPDDGLELLPAQMSGMRAVELGCGTGYVAAWMTRRGAQVTGIDVSPSQLATARRLAALHALEIDFIEGNAEQTSLPDGAFDFAFSEYGASIWCRPELWLREAWRLLRPGGRLVFLGNHPLTLICAPLNGAPSERVLHRPYRNMWGADWTKVEIEPSGVCYNLTISDWMGLFAQIGFRATQYHEIYAPDWAEDTRGAIPAEWAKEYPVEQVWFLEKPA